MDPLAEAPENIGYSSYHYVWNNPIKFIDPDGRHGESTHIDADGNVIAEYDDGDNGVYVHDNGTTQSQVDEQRQGGKYTGGEGKYIGKLGGNLGITSIYSNILEKHGAEAEGHFGKDPAVLLNWVKRVKQGGDWDLKNNKKTIFGVAWAFDHSSKGGQNKTNFISNGMEGNAADFGNHRAGYTGTKAGIPEIMQKIGAGVIKQLKMKNYNSFNPQNWLYGPDKFFTAPHHDRQRDYECNTLGMKQAKGGN